MDSNTVSSIYIPRMSSFVTQEDIAFEFNNTYSNCVTRVDFTSVNKKPGFVEETSTPFKAAFVHFMYPLNEFFATDIVQALMEQKAYKHQTMLFQEYWLILPNKNPVPYTMMNNAQIVENCRYLEQKVLDQDKTIAELKEIITNLTNDFVEYKTKTDNMLLWQEIKMQTIKTTIHAQDTDIYVLKNKFLQITQIQPID